MAYSRTWVTTFVLVGRARCAMVDGGFVVRVVRVIVGLFLVGLVLVAFDDGMYLCEVELSNTRRVLRFR